MNDSHSQSTSCTQDVTLWMAASPLVVVDGDEPLRLAIPESLRGEFDGLAEVEVTWDQEGGDAACGHSWSAAPGGRLFQWLVEYFQEHSLHVAPVSQPDKVHPLTSVLFAAFELEQGSLQLGGCTLEDRPLLWQTRLNQDGQWSHQYFTLDGAEAPSEWKRELELDCLEPIAPPRSKSSLSDEEISAWAARCEPHRSNQSGPVVMQGVVWCKYAIGELTAKGEADRLRLPFEGWAAQILEGKVKPPPYREEVTGDESYSLVRLDDGRLTASTAVGVCQASNKRVLRTQLLECPATKQRALEEFFSSCPVTGDLVITESLRPCAQCRELVGAHCLDANQVCRACQRMQVAGPGDPRLARILGEHPGLSAWRRWRLSETANVYIVTATALFRKLLVVLDRDTLAPRHLAVRSRFSKTWTTPSDLEQQELLAGR